MSRFAEGASALVTGAGGGIGRAIVTRLINEGLTVSITDRDAEAVKALAAELPAEKLHVLAGDITEADFRKEVVASSVERFGRLDVLINNAGIMSGAAPEQISEADWDRVNGINAKAPFFMAQEAIPHLIKTGGAIVSQSSVLGVRAFNGLAAYTASKAAVIGMTIALAADLADSGVRVNALCPGTIDTSMPWAYAADVLGPDHEESATREIFTSRHMIKRLGTPDEVAAAAVFLASNDASFITGVALPVDGGWSAW